MSLRLRLVLTTLVAGVPALFALWIAGNSIRDARDDDLFKLRRDPRFRKTVAKAKSAAGED